MPLRPDIARNVEAGMDGQLEYLPNPMAQFMPKYHVYIFNIGPLKHVVEKGSLGTFTIMPCEAGKQYSKPLVLPSVVRSSYKDAATYAMKTDDVEGKYIAQDIVNPYLGGDWSEGQDLTEKGVFWTFNEVPTQEELSTAKSKMEAYFRRLLVSATELETKGQLQFITPTMRLAASYFGEDRPWNSIYKKIGECPSCGEPAKEGIIRHSCGYIFDVQRAYEADFIDLEKRNELLTRRGLPHTDEAEGLRAKKAK
jgi:hypothetical protein